MFMFKFMFIVYETDSSYDKKLMCTVNNESRYCSRTNRCNLYDVLHIRDGC